MRSKCLFATCALFFLIGSACSERKEEVAAKVGSRGCLKNDFDDWGAYVRREGEIERPPAICVLRGSHWIGTTYMPDPFKPEPCPPSSLRKDKDWELATRPYVPGSCSVDHFPPFAVRLAPPPQIPVQAGVMLGSGASCPPNETCQKVTFQGHFSSTKNTYSASAPGMTLFVQNGDLVGRVPASLAGQMVRVEITARNQYGGASSVIDLVVR